MVSQTYYTKTIQNNFEVEELAHFSEWEESCVCNLSIMRL